MPWNDNANPGPWGSPPSSNDDEPALQPGRRPPPAPPPAPPPGPDLAEVMRRARAEWGRLTRGRRARRLTLRLVGLGAAGLGTLWILSGFYMVPPDQAAVVTRLGEFDRVEGPGLRVHLPTPVERADLVDSGHDQKIVIGGDSAPGGSGESQMPTSDDGLLNIVFAVQYRITDPIRWLYQVRDPDLAIRAAAESAMRATVAHADVATVLSGDRGPIQARAQVLTQHALDGDHLGVAIQAVKILAATPPAAAEPAWQDIARAGQDAQASVNAANVYANKTVADAQLAAARTAQAAAVYQEQVVHEANGEASRFDQIYAQYRQAPAVTRQRLYIQTMEDVLSHAHTVIVGARNSQILLSPQATSPAATPAAGPGKQP